MPAPLLVVDAPLLLYRSFFGVPASVKGVEDRPVNALLGTANTILRACRELSPRAVVVCFGAEEAAYRVELFAGYHAAREPMPDALRWQFEHAPRLFHGFGWEVVGDGSGAAEGGEPELLEADDFLGAYASCEATAGGRTMVFTGDRDMYQCASDAVTVVFLKQGSSEFDLVDPAEVVRRYGVLPEQVPDFIALRGDPSDGLPGAPGIGEKTAAKLLLKFGTLEALLDAVGSVEQPREDHGERPRVAAALRENAALLRAFREIATLQPITVERPEDRPTDLAGGAAAAAAAGMGNLARRLQQAESLNDL